jgi:hypothetical protein
MLNNIKSLYAFMAAAVIGISSLSAQTLKTPAPSPLQTIKQAFALSEISIEYSRPSSKGRVIYGDLVPYGKVWRTGANGATKVTFGEDVKVEGNKVAAGTYALYTIPNKDNWEIMLYKDLKLGGNTNDYKKENEALRFSVKPKAISDKVETFTINLSDMSASSTQFEMTWANTKVSFKITADFDSTIMKNIDNVMSVDGRPFYQAANYYYENGKDLNKALEWVNKAADQNPKAYWVLNLKANIEMKLKDYKAAAATAEKLIVVARDAKADEYVIKGEVLLADAKKAQ